MGIPSYFSYIIKNYSNIIRKLEHFNRFDHLFMDCNSIVYDVYNSMEKDYVNHPFDISKIEDLILDKVVEKIKGYIQYISPKYSVFIAFDGIAPLAKMEQQRKRRYKSAYMNHIEEKTKLWNTVNITPGMPFMKKLSSHMYNAFRNKETEFGLKKMIVSCSDERGEGEHKLFEYIRKNDVKNDTIAIYGLDSDLIMLSLFHIQYTKNIVIFREAPEFKVLPNHKNMTNENLFMDISKLYVGIKNEMINGEVNDYIFMCFLLGNDFMPHIPCLNIRTNGIQILMDTYRRIIGKYNDRILVNSENQIQWKWVDLLLSEIAKKEHEYLLQEYELREKMEKDFSKHKDENWEKYLLNLPILYRHEEKYINPSEKGWEKRYYRILFDMEGTNENIKKMAKRYKEGLEWVLSYYVKGSEKEWKYEKEYGPLIKDMINGELKKEKSEKVEIDEEEQLKYVLPLNEIERMKKKYIEKNYVNPKEYNLKLGYIRYMWEAKVKLPEIEIGKK